ncbi:desmethyl-deoxy-podophyllotoxin synthase-like [Mercurialis annua]|uniref:desmethyl-deoxy-podophyllotoxin synthase-like n=1 Tax=Mercurialis annua TaxID=3986 RepID=UPI00215F6D03|nr:desmethyl-deoxy-podophyllotoxin synthase-like [Mercurialis annua]
MEYKFSFIPVFLTFFLFMVMVFRIWKKSKISNSIPNLPPGPWKLPIIGSMHHLAGSLPHRRLRDLANKYGPLMHLQMGELSNIVVSSPEMAKEVMKTYDIIFAQRPYMVASSIASYNFKDIVFAPYGDYWRQMRKICTLELLTAKRVLSFRSIREEEVSKLIKSLHSVPAGTPINFSKLFNTLTYNIISRAAFGKVWKGEDIFIPTTRKLIDACGGFSLADVYPSIKLLLWLSGMVPKIKKLHQQMDSICQNIIDDHRAERAKAKSHAYDEEDFVDVLLNCQEQGELDIPLTDDNIKAVLVDTFAAGSDTSSTTVEWVMSELLKNPKAMEKTQEEVRRVFGREGKVDEARIHELNYLKLVIKETLRLHPPSPLLLPRECSKNCVINGYDVQEKSQIIVNAWAIGRDPNYWTEAEKFYPERFQNCSVDYKGTNFELIPFGAGRRICPGLLFGIANVELPLAQLLYHFDWKLPNGLKPETLDMDEAFGAAVKRKNDLYLLPKPYSLPVAK